MYAIHLNPCKLESLNVSYVQLNALLKEKKTISIEQLIGNRSDIYKRKIILAL